MFLRDWIWKIGIGVLTFRTLIKVSSHLAVLIVLALPAQLSSKVEGGLKAFGLMSE